MRHSPSNEEEHRFATDASPASHRLRPTAEHVRQYLIAARSRWVDMGWPNALCDTVEVVLAEALNNISEHAHPTTEPDSTIQTAIGYEDGEVVLDIRDNGLAMPGLKIPDAALPELNCAIAELPEGGFGWFMIRSLAKEAQYRRTDGWNHLRIVIGAEAA